MTTRPAVVFYDGRCGLCRASMERVRALDREGRLTFRDLDDPRVAAEFPSIDPAKARERMQLIRPEGGPPLEGFDAARWIARRLPSTRLWAPLLHLPGAAWAGRRIYDRIARRRHRCAVT